MYTTHNIKNFETLLRKVIYGFIQRLEDSSNVFKLLQGDGRYALLIGSAGLQNCIIMKCFVAFSYEVFLVASLRLHVTFFVHIVEVNVIG